VLHPQTELFEVLKQRAKTTKPSAPLFPAWTNVRRDLAIACASVSIPNVTPNDLRRTFATWQAEAGVAEIVIATLLGHTSSQMVRKVYAKIGEQSKRDALAKLPRLIDPTVTLSVTAPGRKRGRRVQSKHSPWPQV
jgi:integrase